MRKVVHLWAERSERLGGREDISYVLVFENRGAEVGATITHPHGQIYAFDFVPEASLRELEHGTLFDESRRALVATAHGWRAWVPVAPVFPFALLLVPDEQVPDLPMLSDAGRRGLAEILVHVLGRLDRILAAQTPYMLCIHQRLFDGGASRAHGCTSRSSPPGVAPTYPGNIAAGELARVSTSSVAPEAAAESFARQAAVEPHDAAAIDRLLFPGRKPSWESPELQSLNRLPPRATLVSYPTPTAAVAHPGPSPLRRSLNGVWEFRLVDRPAAAGAAARSRRGWDRVDVPGLWTMQGYEQPHYTNVVMPFRDPPPHVPEANPTGIYRRSFTIPRGWRGRRIVLGFGGVEGVLHLVVNGEPSASRRTPGHRRNSTSPTSFDTVAPTSSSPSSCAGRTRASSRIRISGGTRASRGRSTSAPTASRTSS